MPNVELTIKCDSIDDFLTIIRTLAGQMPMEMAITTATSMLNISAAALEAAVAANKKESGS